MNFLFACNLASLIIFCTLNLTTGKTERTRDGSKQKGSDNPLAENEDNLSYAAEYLQQFGYLDKGVTINDLNDRKLKKLLVAPLKKFQRFHNIGVTGKVTSHC